MGDSVKKYHEMMEEKILSDQGGEYTVPYKGAEAKSRGTNANEAEMYIFVLDFLDGKVYRYDISSLCNDQNWSSPNYWNPDSETCEAFLTGAGHSIGNIEWMTTNKGGIEFAN